MQEDTDTERVRKIIYISAPIKGELTLGGKENALSKHQTMLLA